MKKGEIFSFNMKRVTFPSRRDINRTEKEPPFLCTVNQFNVNRRVNSEERQRKKTYRPKNGKWTERRRGIKRNGKQKEL